jgi:hypothetical protein
MSKLDKLPETLDETYERMLLDIDEEYHEVAIIALRWLALAERPLSLLELEEACITSHEQKPYVDEENRAEPGSIIHILSSLVLVPEDFYDWFDSLDDAPDGELASPEPASKSSHDDYKNSDSYKEWYRYGRISYPPWDSPASSPSIHIETPKERYQRLTSQKVRLAHFSIQEYLCSDRITHGKASLFAIKPARDHRRLSQDCIAYYFHTTNQQEHEEYALSLYTSTNWHIHQSYAELNADDTWENGLETEFLQSEYLLEDLRTQVPRASSSFLPPESTYPDESPPDSPSGLYFAAWFYLPLTLEWFYQNGCNIDQRLDVGKTRLRTPLGVAAEYGLTEIIKQLLSYGAITNNW